MLKARNIWTLSWRQWKFPGQFCWTRNLGFCAWTFPVGEHGPVVEGLAAQGEGRWHHEWRRWYSQLPRNLAMHRRRWRRMDEVDHVSIAWPFSWVQKPLHLKDTISGYVWIQQDANIVSASCWIKQTFAGCFGVSACEAILRELRILFAAQDPGMWSTVEDYVKFCQMLLTGARRIATGFTTFHNSKFK